MQLRWRTLGCALLLALLAGCGNEQKADMYLVFDTMGQHPEVNKASERWLLAETLAAMRLDAAQAKALLAWAESDGAKTRGDLDAAAAKAGKQAADTRLAADELLTTGAGTFAERNEIALRHNLDPADPMKLNDQIAPGGKPGQDDLVSPEALKRLRPAVAALSEEQRCIAVGGWLDALRAVAELQMATSATAVARRAAVVDKMQNLWVEPVQLEPVDNKKLQAAVARIDIGRAQPAAPEAVLRQLMSAAPAKPAAEQIEAAGKALGALLALDCAPELLNAIR